jgi:hypothetical protein
MMPLPELGRFCWSLKACGQRASSYKPSCITAEPALRAWRGGWSARYCQAPHRAVQVDDPVEAAEVILLTNLLLRIVQRAEVRLRL